MFTVCPNMHSVISPKAERFIDCRQQGDARKPGRVEALEGEEVPIVPPTSYRHHLQHKSVQSILAKTRVAPQSPVPWGKGEKLRTETFKVRDGGRQACGLWRLPQPPHTQTTWGSTLWGLSGCPGPGRDSDSH